jgi:hypothetical protein
MNRTSPSITTASASSTWLAERGENLFREDEFFKEHQAVQFLADERLHVLSLATHVALETPALFSVI